MSERLTINAQSVKPLLRGLLLRGCPRRRGGEQPALRLRAAEEACRRLRPLAAAAPTASMRQTLNGNRHARARCR
jgi:hypothetical protein